MTRHAVPRRGSSGRAAQAAVLHAVHRSGCAPLGKPTASLQSTCPTMAAYGAFHRAPVVLNVPASLVAVPFSTRFSTTRCHWRRVRRVEVVLECKEYLEVVLEWK